METYASGHMSHLISTASETHRTVQSDDEFRREFMGGRKLFSGGKRVSRGGVKMGTASPHGQGTVRSVMSGPFSAQEEAQEDREPLGSMRFREEGWTELARWA